NDYLPASACTATWKTGHPSWRRQGRSKASAQGIRVHLIKVTREATPRRKAEFNMRLDRCQTTIGCEVDISRAPREQSVRPNVLWIGGRIMASLRASARCAARCCFTYARPAVARRAL